MAGRYPDVAACKAEGNLAILDLELDQSASAEAAGRLEFDSAAWSRCDTAVRANFCDGLGFEESLDCDAVLVGKVPDGEPCTSDDECIGGSSCSDGQIQGQCYGECVTSCGAVNCSDTEYCDNDNLCQPLAGKGDSCDWDDMCEPGLKCFETCETPRTVSEGGACNRESQCKTGLTCRNQMCTAFTYIARDQPCELSDSGTGLCEAGTVCTNLTLTQESATGTCDTPKALGGECRIWLECQGGLTCSATDPSMVGQCVELFANGANCSSEFDCESFRCDEGKCTAQTSNPICEIP